MTFEHGKVWHAMLECDTWCDTAHDESDEWITQMLWVNHSCGVWITRVVCESLVRCVNHSCGVWITRVVCESLVWCVNHVVYHAMWGDKRICREMREVCVLWHVSRHGLCVTSRSVSPHWVYGCVCVCVCVRVRVLVWRDMIGAPCGSELKKKTITNRQYYD